MAHQTREDALCGPQGARAVSDVVRRDTMP